MGKFRSKNMADNFNTDKQRSDVHYVRRIRAYTWHLSWPIGRCKCDLADSRRAGSSPRQETFGKQRLRHVWYGVEHQKNGPKYVICEAGRSSTFHVQNMLLPG